MLASLAGIVGEFGGHVDKLTGDGIMAVFGAPVAHEDDAERAVRAASRMQSVVRRLVEQESGGGQRLGLRVGLNTGEVIAGVQAHLSYTVIGDAVNTAARLSDAAGVGAVYAGRDTALSTLATASWRALAPLRLKGKREPVPAYELVGLRPPGASRLGLGDEAPFLGRDAEFGLLVGRLLDVADRAVPRTVLLTGDAGVGKTRLAQELSRFCGELPGARVLWGRCAPYGEGRDLAAVAEMVRTACGIGEGDDVETARERVARTVSRLEHPAYAGPVPAAVGRAAAGPAGAARPRTPRRPGRRPRPGRRREAMRCGRPSPPCSRPSRPTRRCCSCSTTCTGPPPRCWRAARRRHAGPRPGAPARGRSTGDARPSGAGAGSGRVVGRPRRRRAGVPAPLEGSAAERLLRAYLGSPSADLDASVTAALLDRAQGNPFFLAELLHLLVDRGVLRRDGDHWQVTGDLPEEVLPAGVQAVLAARIDALDGPAKGVLRDASVLGLRLDLAGLEAVGRASGHGEPSVVRAAVAVLQDRRMLEADPDDGQYRFGHTLVRDVAYAGLAKAERARRHAAAAAHVAAGGGRPGEADLVAAAQGERAVRLAAEMGLPPQDPAWQARALAFTALARLGRAALARDENAMAEQVLARALSLGHPSFGEALPDRVVVPVRLAHASALAAQHRLVEAEAELVPALAAAQDEVRAGALVVLGDVRRKQGDTAGARQALVSALAAAGSAGDDRLGGEALRLLGLLDYFDGRLRGAEERFRQAHALAVQVDDARGAGWALQHLAWSATSRGDYAAAGTALGEAAEVFAALEDTGGLSWVAGTEGFVRLLQGRLGEARELAGSVLPLGQAMGERWGVAALLTIDALAAAEQGDTDLAADEAAQALQRFEEVGDAWGRAMALIAVGITARRADRPDRAVELLTQAVEVSEQARHPLLTTLALVALGYACLDRDDLDAAHEAVRRAQDVLGGLDLAPSALLGPKVLLAQVLRRRGDLQGALAQFDEALATTTEAALLFPRRQALAHRAGTLLDLGRPAEALAGAQEAVAFPGEDVRSQVLALRALGSALLACGRPDDAVARWHEALDLARATGQGVEAATTTRLLAAAGSSP